nr:hypothetical protein [Tanacetum cinerariifolium]
MPLTPDLSFTSLDEFVNEPVVKNCKAMSSKEEVKVVRKHDDALIIKECVSDDEENDVSQPKIEKKYLDEFVNEPVVKNCKAMSSKEEVKVVRKHDDALIIKECVSDDEENDVS